MSSKNLESEEENWQNYLPNFGDYIIYVDESGDHNLEKINPEYPLFVLAFCIFKVEDYVQKIVPKIQELKFKFFGHDSVIFHEADIKKQTGMFKILTSYKIKNDFHMHLNTIISEAPFTIIASVVDKMSIKSKDIAADNVYHLALKFGLEKAFLYLNNLCQVTKKTFVIFESRGKKQDIELKLEFNRFMESSQTNGMNIDLNFLCVSKQVNSTGLKLADMVARPIGRHTLNSEQENRAWDIIKHKLYKSPEGKITDWGLSVYP